MKQWMKKIAALTAIALTVSGCVSNSNLTSTTLVKNWHFNGKIGLMYPDPNCAGSDCRRNSDQGKISWTQKNKDYDISLQDPFNRIVMRLNGNNDQLTAIPTGQDPITTTPSAFLQLVTRSTGNESALSGLNPAWLSYWVTGRPAPQTPSQRENDERFTQRGYTIAARQWRTTAAGNMPSLIIITKRDFTMRLVVKQWMKTK